MSFHRIENSAICWARLSRLQLKVIKRNKATLAHRHPPTQPIPTFLIHRNSGHCGQNPKFWILRAPADFHPDPPRVRAIKLQCNAILWDSPVHMDCRPVQCSGWCLMQCKAEFQAGFRQYLKQLPEENLMGKEGRRRKSWKWELERESQEESENGNCWNF